MGIALSTQGKRSCENRFLRKHLLKDNSVLRFMFEMHYAYQEGEARLSSTTVLFSERIMVCVCAVSYTHLRAHETA